MSVRATILNQLNQLDTTTLQKLYEARNFIFYPDQDILTKVTYTDMINKAHALADIHFPEWTDRSKSDFGEFLVELFSLFSWKDFAYQNNLNKEAVLRRGNSYVYVALNAIKLGYVPVQQTSSGCSANITFSGLPAGKTYPPGSFEIQYNDTELIFTNKADVVVAAGTSTISVPLASGKYVSNAGTFNGKSIRVQAVKVDPASVLLSFENVAWTKVNSFAIYDNTSKVFMVLPSEGDEIETVFGSQGFGQRPAIGQPFTISYRLDSVETKNVAVAVMTVSKNVENNYITAVTMLTAATGGAIAESIESVRENSSMLYRTYGQGKIVVPADAIAILQADPSVNKAHAFNFANTLYFSVIPANGVPADQPFVDALSTALLEGKSIMGYTLAPSLTSYVTINDITGTAFIYNDFDPVEVENQIRDYFYFITNPMEGAAYGVGLDLGKTVQELKEKIPGLYNFVFSTVNNVAAADITLSPLQIFNTIAVGDLTLTVTRTS